MPGSTVTTIPAERLTRFAGSNVEANVMAEAVNVILAELFPAQVFAVELCTEGNFIQAVAARFAEIHSGSESGENGILRAKNDVGFRAGAG